MFGKGATKGVIHRVPLKLQAKKKIFSFNLLYSFFSLIGLVHSSGASLLTVERKTKGEFLAKGTAAALIFNHETNWQGHSFTPSKTRSGGNIARTREWTFHLNSEGQFTCTFYREIFLVSFWIQL